MEENDVKLLKRYLNGTCTEEEKAIVEIWYANWNKVNRIKIPEAKLFEELGLDSLDAVDMLVYLEENLGVKVEGERLAKIRTLQDVYQLVAEVQLNTVRMQSKDKSEVSQ